MFGALDIAYWQLYSKKLDHLIGEEHFEEPLFVDRKTQDLWVCFLPWRTSLKEANLFGLLPRNDSLLIYEGPPSLVGTTPTQAKESLLRLIDYFDEHKFMDMFNCKVLGLSIGTLPAFYLANHFSVQKIVTVAAGARLGENIYSSLATQEVKKRAILNGFETSEDYDHRMKGYNPIDNLDDLPFGEIYIELAEFDKHIPTRSGMTLISELRKKKIGHTFQLNRCGDHSSTILGWGMRNRFGQLPYMN